MTGTRGGAGLLSCASAPPGGHGRGWSWRAIRGPVLAMLLSMLATVVSSSPAPLQGDPAPGRSPGPPTPTPTLISPTLDLPVITSSSSPLSPSPQFQTDPDWCHDYPKEVVQSAPLNDVVRFSVGHALFRTDPGLVNGVHYKVWVRAPPGIVKDFSLWTKHGFWVAARSSSLCSDDQTGASAGAGGIQDRSGLTGGADDALQAGEALFFWSTSETRPGNTTFRLRYRMHAKPLVVFEKHLHAELREDCSLWLWPNWGDLSWLDLPRPADCTVWFPDRNWQESQVILTSGADSTLTTSMTSNLTPSTSTLRPDSMESNSIGRNARSAVSQPYQLKPHNQLRTFNGKQQQLLDGDDVVRDEFNPFGSLNSEDRAMGLLVELARLNVACTSGGWLRLGNGQRLCGKLEELSSNQRRLHFPQSPALQVFGAPVFLLKYRLVDYCHQVAMTDRNASVVLAAAKDLQCKFSISLPYGYRAHLKLTVGSPVPGLTPETKDITSDSPTEAKNWPNTRGSSSQITKPYLRALGRLGPPAGISSARPKKPRPRREKEKSTTPATQLNISTTPISTSPSIRTASVVVPRGQRASLDTDAQVQIFSDEIPTHELPEEEDVELLKRLTDNDSESSSDSDQHTQGTISENIEIFSDESSEVSSAETSSTKPFRTRRDYNDVIIDAGNGDVADEESSSTPIPSDALCQGTFLNLTDGTNNWTHCAQTSDLAGIFRFLSAKNVLELTVQMGRYPVPLRMDYESHALYNVTQNCAFGWVAIGQFCVTVVDDLRLPWTEAETECQRRGGHLASITDELSQKAVDELITNSPGYSVHNAYWIGASDVTNEGDFRWTDSLPFSYTNWFPGWTQHGGYNRQPNDDGFSGQDCVELRRDFGTPAAASGPRVLRLSHLDRSFRWNDRDCHTRNHYLCERPRDSQTFNGEEWAPGDCGRSVNLSRENQKATVTSPGFPGAYPDNSQCDTDITAPPGYRIVLDFEEFVLENEPYYDYLEIVEDMPDTVDPSLHEGLGPPGTGTGTGTGTAKGSEGDELQRRQSPRKFCGDWSDKLKLLRYVSRGPKVRLRFVSDYNHNMSGFLIRVSIETMALECSDGRLHMFNNSCFLIISFPQVTWHTAKQVCYGMKAELAEVLTAAEQDFVVSRIRHSTDYSTSNTYWLGGQLGVDGHWGWVSGRAMDFTGWLPAPSSIPDPVQVGDPQDSADSTLPSSCLGLQWVTSPALAPALPSGLYWRPRRCSATGGYVCRRQHQPVNLGAQLNASVTEPGALLSPGYPSGYPSNLDYWVRLTGPARTRVVIRFANIDLESQAQCLYDFIELSDASGGRHVRKKVCGQHNSSMNRFDFVSGSNEAILRFHSDYSVSGSGFKAVWSAVDISGCPEQTLSAREGVLTSPNYPHRLLPNLRCTASIRAPSGRRVWLELLDVDLGGNAGSSLKVDLGSGRSVSPLHDPALITAGVLLASSERMDVSLSTRELPRGKGFKARYRAITEDPDERVLYIPANSSVLQLRHLNFPAPPPRRVNFLQRFLAPLGVRLQIQLYGVVLARGSSPLQCPGGAGHLEVRDSYADTNGSVWVLCEALDASAPSTTITSYLNSLQLWQRGQQDGVMLNATLQPIADPDYRMKLVRMSNATWSVESCSPNPCQNDGKCLVRDGRRVCECRGHFTGLLCSLTECDLEPCVWGKCELTPIWFRCRCAPHYKGTLCNVRAKPCADNPCEGRGECHEKGDSFHCRCHAWWEGPRCDRRMSVPFKPLSERMLQEPFWLGLITVMAVLGVIGLFWCAKRHFPEKLEKLLAEEADRNRSGGIYPARGASLRDQLAVAVPQQVSTPSGAVSVGGGGGRGDMGNTGGGAGGVSRDGAPSRSLLGRLGIRKPSIPSLSACSAEPAARTCSFDDLLRPPTGRTPSPRKKRNNSTPTRQHVAVDAAEKKQILQQLVASGIHDADPLLLDTLADSGGRNSSRTSSRKPSRDEDSVTCETSFSNVISLGGDPPHKLEKKVTFARLLNKVSAEISSGSERENLTSQNGIARSPPHSTSSNPGSDSISSLDVGSSAGGSPLDACTSRRAQRFLSLMRYCDQDMDDGGATSDDSSHLTPGTSSSGAPDSPPLPRSTNTTPTPPTSTPTSSSTIEVTVLDPLCAGQRPGGATILLEVPNSGSRNLSPITEVPTPCPSIGPSPLPSPLPTPIPSPTMPRANHNLLSPPPSGCSALSPPSTPTPTATATPTPVTADDVDVSSGSISMTPSPASLSPCPPAVLVIPEVRVEQPSPTKSAANWDFEPGSPPPHRTALRDRPADLEKPTWLDLPFITVTCSAGEIESDVESGSGFGSGSGMGAPDAGPSGLLAPATGMTYLSPFSMCSRADRIASESNLSSSGYSSMASPGPSRCGSSNPLCSSEAEVFQADHEDASSGHTHTSAAPLRSTSAHPPPTRRASEGTAVDAGFYPTLCRPPRGRSDSETFSDDAVIESNDEGFSTDTKQSFSTLQQANTGEIAQVAPPRRPRQHSLDSSECPVSGTGPTSGPAVFLACSPADKLSPRSPHITLECSPGSVGDVGGLSLLTPAIIPISLVSPASQISVPDCPPVLHEIDENPASPCTGLLALPSIVVEGDGEGGGKCLSPVSSRSESPLSDRPGVERFSPAFYGRQLPFTDSDGLYDGPSSAGSAPASTGHHRKCSSRRRERRPTSARTLARSPPKNLLDVPGKDIRDSKHSSPRKPSPKRRSRNSQPALTSSSSDESLNSIRDAGIRASSPLGEKLSAWTRTQDCSISHPSTEASGEDTAEEAASGSPTVVGKPTWEKEASSFGPVSLSGQSHRKISRLKTIGHQIRFLRRLEMSLRRRQRLSEAISPSDSVDSGDDTVTAPLLTSSPPAIITPASGLSLARSRHRFRQKTSVDSLLAPGDLTRSVMILPAAATSEHRANRAKVRHTD